MSQLSAISVTRVDKNFGAIRALEQVSLEVRKGDLVALVGPSGSGKTTLLRTIAGFEEPDSGSVRIGDREVVGDRMWVEPEQRRIGMVFQDGALFPHLTVAKNLAFGDPRPGRAEECLEMVGLAHRASAYPHELSGGERQRIALARALATDPDVVLLDEPFASLDEGLRVSLREEVLAILRAAGATAVLVTHNQQEALSLADSVVVMRSGRVEQVGAPEEVYSGPATRWVAEFLGDADVLPGTAADGVADCELGRFSADPALRGAVEVVFRPETLALVAGTNGTATAQVVNRSYFGHDQLVHLELGSGVRLRSRLPGTAPWRTGDTVHVEVTGPVTVLGPEPVEPSSVR